MKKRFRFISVIAAAMIAVMSFSCCLAYAGSTDTTKNSESSKPIYLALGDSITYGYAPPDDPDGDVIAGKQLIDECFVNILAKEKGYTAVNKGINGNTAVGIQSQLDSGELDDVVEKAQIVTITCGGNDLMEVVYTRAANYFNNTKQAVKLYGGTVTKTDIFNILAYKDKYNSAVVNTVQMSLVMALNGVDTSADFKTALDQYITDLNKVTATIKAKNPDVKIYLATQYNPFEHFVGTYASVVKPIGSAASVLRDRVIANAEAGQYTVVDVYSAFLGNTASYCNATEDPLYIDFHPSIAGHAAIAKCFAEVVPQAEVKPDPTPSPDADTNPDADSDSAADSGSSASKGNAVDTGDDTTLWIPAGIMAASAGAIAVLIAARRKVRAR